MDIEQSGYAPVVSSRQIRVLQAGLVLVVVCVVLTSIALVKSEIDASSRQRDFCQLLAIVADPSGPAPTTGRGTDQQSKALAQYRAKDC